VPASRMYRDDAPALAVSLRPMVDPTSEPNEVDVAVAGAGLRGLLAALRTARERPDARLLVIDAAPQPGGSVRTHRTNGFVCELGPFAFAAEELAPFTALLPALPPRVACLPSGRTGWRFDGSALQPLAVEPLPWTFRTGNEELVQACRRALDGRLRLGRAVTAIAATAGAFTLTLGGDVEANVRARELVIALPDAAAGALLGAFDRALPAAAARMGTTPAAMVFLGGDRAAAPLRGYGIVPGPGVDSPVAEVVCCSEVFPDRALPGRCLVRVELAGDTANGDDDAVADLATAELQRWTGAAAACAFGLRKVHRFPRAEPGGAAVEVRVRLREVATRVPGLVLA
jgi:protoporphyrinogen oxidase